jgi:hypothetical protein
MGISDLPSLMENVVQYRVHPPLCYALTHFWLVLGQEEFLLRFFSVLGGVISVSIKYVAASLVGGKRLGVLAALMLAGSPFHVWHSQEARMHALTTMLVLAASVGFLRLPRADTMANWVAYVGSTAQYDDFLSNKVAPVLSSGGVLRTMTVSESGSAHRFLQGAEQSLMETVRGDEPRQSLRARTSCRKRACTNASTWPLARIYVELCSRSRVLGVTYY